MFSVQIHAKSLQAASTYWESRCDGELRVKHYDAGLEFQTHFNGLLNITQHTPNTEYVGGRREGGG